MTLWMAVVYIVVDGGVDGDRESSAVGVSSPLRKTKTHLFLPQKA
jgi:hypothetical protein